MYVDEFIFGDKDTGLNGSNGKIVITQNNVINTPILKSTHIQKFDQNGFPITDPYNLSKLNLGAGDDDDGYNNSPYTKTTYGKGSDEPYQVDLKKYLQQYIDDAD